jgi:hypothetical protein
VLQGYQYWTHSQSAKTEVRSAAQAEVVRGAEEIGTRLSRLGGKVDTIVDDLQTGSLDKHQVQDRLRQTVLLGHQRFMAGAVFAPYAYEPNLRLFAPAYIYEGATPRYVELDVYSDYTEKHWYKEVLTHDPGWIGAFFDQILGELVVAYTAPFQLAGNEAASEGAADGFVFMFLPVSFLTDLLADLDAGETGYAYINDADGRFIAHPNYDLVKRGATVQELSASEQESLAVDEDGLVTLDIDDRGTLGLSPGDDSWTLTAPVSSTSWQLVLVSGLDHLRSPLRLRRQLIRIILLVLVLLAAAACLLLRSYRFDVRRLWLFATVFSLLVAASIGCVWQSALRFPSYLSTDHTRCTSTSALRSFKLANMKKALALNEELPVYIPTGLFVQSITFSTANDVTVTGYIWQKYRTGLHDGITRGTVMAESLSGSMVEAYSKTSNGIELRGWRFSVNLRQEFDYTKYPFNYENIWIQLWPKDFHRNVVLVPDVDAYKYLNPRFWPGVRRDVVLPGWTIDESFFSYRAHSYTTNFGFKDYVGQEGFPELYFNMIVRHGLRDPFVTYLLPLAVVLIMLFSLLMLGSLSEEKMERLGFSAQNVIGSCAAFFLVAIFSHIDLRQSLEANTLIYLELFYFVVYILILGVSINALLFAKNSSAMLQYRENLLPKLLYWPVTLLAILIITVAAFY